MKKIVLIFVAVLVVYHAASLPAVYGQAKKDEITAEEKKAANDLAERFIQRLDETGDIEPLTKEMFVSDFMQRYVAENKHEVAAGHEGKRILFATTGLEYDATLLDQAGEDAWLKLYISSFNVLHYAWVVTFNEGAKYYVKGKTPGDDVLEKTLNDMYPRPVLDLFNGNPLLKNFV